MSDERLKKTLEGVFPETPAIFHARMAEIAGRAGKKRAAFPRRFLPRALLIGGMALMLCGAAVAAMTHYGVLNFNAGWEDAYYFTLPEAKNMIQYDLCAETTGSMEWRVKEAIYDGRVLRILYSARDLSQTDSFPALEGEETLGYASDAYDALATREGVFLKCDGNGEVIVNGMGVNLQSVDKRPGEKPGEIECWIDCRMEYYDRETGEFTTIQPEGLLTIELPFSFHRERAEGEAEGLRFTLNAGDAASRYALSLPDPLTLENGTVFAFTDLHFSPATVFIDFTLTVPAARVPKLPDKGRDFIGYDEALMQFSEYKSLWTCRLENARGEQLGYEKDGYSADRQNADGSLTFTRHWESTPSEKYTETIYLCVGSWKIPIPMIQANGE